LLQHSLQVPDRLKKNGAASGDPLTLEMSNASRLKCFKGGWMLHADELLAAPSLETDCTDSRLN